MLCPKCGKSIEIEGKVSLCEQCSKTATPATIDHQIDISSDKEITEVNENVDFGPAGFWLRVGAFIIDNVVLSFCYLIVAFLFGATLISSILLMITMGSTSAMSSGLIVGGGAVLFLIGILMFLFIFKPACEYCFGGTPGKLILGLRVVDNSGNGISIGQTLARQFLRFVNTFFFALGYILPIFTQHKQAIHDYVTNTFVIKKERLSPVRIWGSVILACIINIALVSGFSSKKNSFSPPTFQPNVQHIKFKAHNNNQLPVNFITSPPQTTPQLPTKAEKVIDTTEAIPALPNSIKEVTLPFEIKPKRELNEFERRLEAARELKKQQLRE